MGHLFPDKWKASIMREILLCVFLTKILANHAHILFLIWISVDLKK